MNRIFLVRILSRNEGGTNLYRLFTGLVLVVLLVSAARATETILTLTDGEWWNGLTRSQQTDVMFGSTTAYTDGYADGVIHEADAIRLAIKQAQYLNESQRQSLLSLLVKGVREGEVPEFTSQPIDSYIGGMTSFFLQHPEARKMLFSDVFECIQDKPSITCDDVASRYTRDNK